MNNQPNTIRIMLVDDHEMVLKSLATFLEVFEDLEYVGSARSGDEAIQLCEILQPDVVLMDIRMPEMDGITATRIIRQSYPDMKVIALSSYHDPASVTEAKTAGMVNYLLKDISTTELALAIRAAQAGEEVILLNPLRL